MARTRSETNQSPESQAALREIVSREGHEVAADDETEVGNYFVANYPPFSFWQPDYLREVERLLDQPAPEDAPLGVYYHIPFCRKRCHFCYFRVYTDKNADEIRHYIDTSMKELEWYAKKAYVSGRKPDFVYFGGGTPSYLSPAQLRQLTDSMKEFLPWDEAREVAFEAEPGTLNEKKLEAIREIGVTRLSLGVENFDDHILELNGRAHRSGEIERAYHYAKEIGFEQINIDLIAGMMDETEENWFRCVEKAIELDPEMITIYQMEIPYNTGIYKEMKELGKATAPVANWATKRRWVSDAFDRLVEAGYSITSATTVVKKPEEHKFVYRDGLWEGADLLSIGVASFGHLGGIHVQNEHNIGPYMEQVEEKGHGMHRAYVTDPEERFVREFILKLKLGYSDFSHYKTKFGIDPAERFASQIADLQRDGFATLNGDRLTVTRAGLLQIDRLLHSFFLSHHRNARYA